MKNFIRLFTLLIGFGVNAQTYTFDYNLKIRNINTKTAKVYTTQYILSSENSNYSIYIHDDKGTLFDSERNIIREFNYSKDVNNRVTYQFFRHTPFRPTDEIKINHIIVEKIGENQYSIKCYSTKKNKSPNLELKVQLKPYNSDFIKFYCLDFSKNIHTKLTNSLKETLNGNFNYIIESYTVDYKNGAVNNNSLEKIEKINLTIAPHDN